ncbi:hypothetical protein Klosneuvirus_5_15 [Klosneuvirus KNV1]|uniref:Uncharacterized protein n=1 Tax=Klosneuvirus KNV1 TaxID=1977640 RepID=A0A1V0SKS9_9VIRU|nr:hypothetical protein Klosneuvirus_5_15 [Klosneuvirus KNV1]
MKPKIKQYTYNDAERIIEAGGDKLISTEFKNGKIPIEVECGECHTRYNVRLQSYLKNSRCNECAIRKRGIKKRTPEDEVKKFVEKKGDIFIRLFFIKGRARVEFICGFCKKNFQVVYFNYQRRSGCRCQQTNFKLNYDYIKKYIENRGDILKSNKIYLSTSLMDIECNKCKQDYQISWDQYKRGGDCRLCNPSKKKTIEEVNMIIEDRGDRLVSTEFKSCNDKLEIKCGTCDKVFETTYNVYRKSNGCPSCTFENRIENQKHSQDYVANYIKEKGDELISTYTRMQDKIDIRCGICHEIYHISFTNFCTHETRCPCITISKGERIIKEYLEKNNIKYIHQKKFPDLRRTLPLSFDFYLSNYNVLIEFDGSIHFKSNDLLGGKKAFDDRRDSDIIKNIFCLNNKIPLLRISYNYIKTIDKIIENYLQKPIKSLIEYSSIWTYCDLILQTCERMLNL